MTNQGSGTRDEGRDRELDAVLAEVRRSYNAPPERPPLDEMWGRIEQGWGGGRRAGGGDRRFWLIGVAAALLVGVGIGRSTSSIGMPATTTAVTPLPPAPRAPTRDPSYDQTTARYLGQTAALLLALPGEARAGRADHRVIARAAELLTTTRLLLDSPAAADPKARALLEDLELVLAQVAHLGVEGARVELELIAQALEQRDLLPRLTSAVGGATEGDN
jgi:hypothetical protein